jgi:hypothetical protein
MSSATDATPKKADWAERFLTVFEDSGIVSESAKAAGVNRSTVYRRRAVDAEFAAAWDQIEEWSTEDLERIAYKRAADGSDTLVIFLLKARRPAIYREAVNVNHGGKVKHEVQIEEQVDDAIGKLLGENERLRDRLAKVSANGEAAAASGSPG